MEVTKSDLKILIKEYLSASNRVLRAGYEIYPSELSKFIRFLDSHEIIFDYIKSCGEAEYDVKADYDEIYESFGRSIFPLGSTYENEVANIYAVLKYLADNNIDGSNNVFYGYSSSNEYQEKVNAFGDKFIRVLITHIENYLNKISIQMGMDDKTTINVKIEGSNLNNSQLNIASDGSSIVTNQTACDIEKLQNLMDELLNASKDLTANDQQAVNECVETIATIKDEKPKKSIIKMALTTLNGIAGTVEFAAAVTSIVQFVEACL